jgi:hypothetical protein
LPETLDVSFPIGEEAAGLIPQSHAAGPLIIERPAAAALGCLPSAVGGTFLSAGFHGGMLIVLACWILPSQPQPTSPNVLSVVFDDQVAPELVTLNTIAPSFSSEILLVTELPAEVALETMTPVLKNDSVGMSQGRRGTIREIQEQVFSGSHYGPKVEFFGNVAYGDRFVFVLDASGSMNEGSRYRRAAAELIRAVEGLDADQWFFVVLFQGQSQIMLGMAPAEAQLLPATEENKAALETWLARMQPDGWSDPRDALDLAIKVQPNAIFLLSDGEFKTGPRTRRIGGVTLTRVRYQNVTHVPIHTLAYEDPINRRILKGLARQSAGTYRYIPPPEKDR